jgi:hypothetical protein
MGALGTNTPSDGSQNRPSLGMFGQGTFPPPTSLFGQATFPPPSSLFGPPKQPGQPEGALAASSTPANPAPTTTAPLTMSFGSTQEPKKEEPAKKA